MKAGLYLHIPFCVQRCHYCDFVSNVARDSAYSKYLQALHQEIALYQELFPDILISTIYFGGGTPSLLSGEQIRDLMQKIRYNFQIEKNGEITLEANPGTMDKEKMTMWLEAGINRLSLGMQAADDRLLKKLGRIHSVDDGATAIKTAKELGFANISLDLMYGLPEQSLKDLQNSLDWFLAQNIQHISIYGLQVEENTVFGRWQEQGKLFLPSEEETEAMYDYIVSTLPSQGFQRYEISNFALPNYESKHNTSYWQDKMYLGLGAGAHGYFNNERVANYPDLKTYQAKVTAGTLPIEERTILTTKAHMEEFCFLSLRTFTGINKYLFAQKFGKSLEDFYGDIIPPLVQAKLVENTASYLRLTSLGMKLGNMVFEKFILD